MADSAAKQTQESQAAAEAAPLVTNSTAPAEAEAEATAEGAAAKTDEEQVSRIAAAIAKARGALEEVRAKVGEYDAQYKASETASAYLGGPIQKAQDAFDQLATTAATMKDKTVEIPTKALSRTLTAANSALEQITELATKYDDKFKLSSTVQKAVSIPREKAHAALVEVSNLAASTSAAANAQLQGVNQGIVSRATALATSGASLLFSTAAALDGRYNIESKAITAGTAVVDRAQKLDERFSVKERGVSLGTNVLERAQGLDSRVTGGKVTPLVVSAFEKGLAMATDGLAYAQTGYEAAKQQRQGKDDQKEDEQKEEGGKTEEAATNASNDAGQAAASSGYHTPPAEPPVAPTK